MSSSPRACAVSQVWVLFRCCTAPARTALLPQTPSPTAPNPIQKKQTPLTTADLAPSPIASIPRETPTLPHSNTSKFTARKLLHIGTALLLLHNAHHVLLVQTVAVGTLVLLRPLRDVIAAFEEEQNQPGIALFVVGVLLSTLLPAPFTLLCVCGPMLFADPMAAIVGRAVRTQRFYGKKTVGGSLAFFGTCLAVFQHGHCTPHLHAAAAIAAALTAVEAVSGAYDNITLVLASALLQYLLHL